MDSKPFTEDRLGRLNYAEGICKLISEINKGVIAIDGEWGVGKTWFGSNLKLLILQREIANAIWIDAFKEDWNSDPVLAIVGSIANTLKPSRKNKFIKNISPAISVLIPTFAKIAAKTAGTAIGIDKELVDDITDAIKGGASSYIEVALKNYTERSSSLTSIKNHIQAEIVANENKKIVIFIDELDRCSPEFSVRLLERLKHLFHIDNVIFIILWNRDQVLRSVENFYGAGTNGSMFLDKFIDFPLNLPISQSRPHDLPLAELANSFLQNFSAHKQLELSDKLRIICQISFVLKINAREIHRLMTWWVMSKTRRYTLLEIWLLGIKVKHPEIYNGLLNEKREAHLQASKLIDEDKFSEQITKELFLFLKELHDRFYKADFSNMTDNFKRNFSDSYNQVEASVQASIRRLESSFD